MRFAAWSIGVLTTAFLTWSIVAQESSSSEKSVFSTASVWSPADKNAAYSAWQKCDGTACVQSKMKDTGATVDALSFVAKIEGEGFLAGFDEKGRVDLGFIEYPSRANTNGAYVMLNGKPSLVSTELQWDAVDISKDPSYARLKQEFPEVSSETTRATFLSAEVLKDGGQRFMFSYPVINGCRACQIPWSSHIAFDFAADGTFKGHTFARLVPNER